MLRPRSVLRFVVVGHGCRVDVLAGLRWDEVGDDEADKASDRSPHSIRGSRGR